MKDIYDEIEERTENIEGMDNWDIKNLIEISFEMIATSYNPKRDINQITARIIERIGFIDIVNMTSPEKIMVLVYYLVSRIYQELSRLSLTETDLFFKRWIGKDIMVMYESNYNKLLMSPKSHGEMNDDTV